VTVLTTPTAEQDALRAAVHAFLSDRASLEDARRLIESPTGFDQHTWRAMSELGWPALLVPAAYEGAGASFAELAVVLEEMGAVLYGGPFLASAVLAITALLRCGDEAAKREYLPRLAVGELIGTLAVFEGNGRGGLDAVRCQAEYSGSGWRLDGHKTLVLDAPVAGLLLVAARSARGLGLFAVGAGGADAEVVAQPVIDGTRRLYRLVLRGCAATPVGQVGAAGPGLRATLDLAAVALAAEQVGGAQQVLDDAVQYAKTRHQFGRPIGSFQAIKHRCADMYVAVQGARAVTAHAVASAVTGADDLSHAASIAKSYSSEAFFEVASENIQVHGGIGFTWEHSAHLYYRRAQASRVLFGDPVWHRHQILRDVGL
jgi:alkylation response protein AidB-like acyl-CoA dehydrogenase